MNGAMSGFEPGPTPASFRWRCRIGPEAPGMSVRSKSKMAALSAAARPDRSVDAADPALPLGPFDAPREPPASLDAALDVLLEGVSWTAVWVTRPTLCQ